MATDVNADLYTEIDNAIARIKTLVSEGNTDGAAELAQEAETMISAIKGKGAVNVRKEYREGVAAALKVEPSREIVARMPETIAEVDGLDELVNIGAERVRTVTEGKIKGGREIAQIQLDIRRRIILPDGTPDLNARSHAAKMASSEIYDRVTANLPAEGEDELADAIRTEIKSVQRAAQNAMQDVRTEYIRALDHSDPEELAHFKGIFDVAEVSNGKTGAGDAISEVVAKHYGIKLQTRAEVEAERRAARAELIAKRESGDELEPEEAAELAGEKYVSPSDHVRKLISATAKAMDALPPGTLGEIKEEDRKAYAESLSATIGRMSALLAQLSR